MDGVKLSELATAVQNRSDFLQFLLHLMENHKRYPDEWENDTIAFFLDSLQGWAQDAQGYYDNNGYSDINVEVPSWRAFADMLLAAKIYE